MKHIFPIGCLFLILTASCVQPVDIPPAPQEVFVKCILMNDTVQTVELYYSGAIGADRFEPVENAVVRIEDSSHDSYDFSYAGNGHYLSDFRPHSGRTYTLDIRIPDRKRITASVRFPKDMQIESRFFPPYALFLDLEPNIMLFGGWYEGLQNYCEQYRIPCSTYSMDLSHICTDKNQIIEYRDCFYEVQILEGSSCSEEDYIYHRMPGMLYLLHGDYPEAMYVVGVNEKEGQFQRAAHLGTTHLYADPSNLSRQKFRSNPDERIDEWLPNPGPQTVEAYHRHLESCIDARYDGLSLYDGYIRIASPKAYDNGAGPLIYNGPYGQFDRSGYNYYYVELLNNPYRDSIVMKYRYYCDLTDGHDHEDPFHARLVDKSWSTRTLMHHLIDASSYFSIFGDISYNYWFEDERAERSSLYFCAVSESYDRYLRDCRSISAEKSGDLLGSLYSDASRIYSNIEGGYGIFGAMYVLRHDCNLKPIPEGTTFDYRRYYDDYGEEHFDPITAARDFSLPHIAYPAPLPNL